MTALAEHFILPSASEALSGRAEAVPVARVNKMTSELIQTLYPARFQFCSSGLGCTGLNDAVFGNSDPAGISIRQLLELKWPEAGS